MHHQIVSRQQLCMTTCERAILHRCTSPWFAPARLPFHLGQPRLLSTTRSDVPTATEYEEFYRYTSGRWLWNESARLRDRYKKFNVPELQRIAAKSCGARSCSQITKLAEGGFNKVFELTMDDGRKMIARIPNPNVGHVFRATASEVATMEFMRTVLDIPVPKVTSWSGNDDNTVDSAYILMEHAIGTNLDKSWQDLEIDDKMTIVSDIVAIQKKFSSISFSYHGSLYFAADAFPGCVEAKVSGSVTSAMKGHIGSQFVIGPIAEQAFYEPDPDLKSVDRGPWSDGYEYLNAVAERERARVLSDKRSPPTTTDDTISLIKRSESVVPHILPKDARFNRGTLWHWDLRLPNIFAKNGRITSVIDWQDVWIGPMFLQAKRPQFVDYHGALLLRLPDHYENIEDPAEKASVTDRVEQSIVLWCYNEDTKEQNPELDELLNLPQTRKRKETIMFLSEISDGGNTPLRECLIQLKRHWHELGTGVDCPLQFAPEEMNSHDQQADNWNDNAEFWSSLDGLVSRDGWTSLETYEEALRLFKDLREQGLSHLTGAELDDFEKQSRWIDEADRVT